MRQRQPYFRKILRLCRLGGATGGALAGAPIIPLEEFAAGAEVAAPRISPDGTQLVFIATAPDGKRFVAVNDLLAHQTHLVMGATSGTYRATGCEFKGNTRLLCHYEGIDHRFGSGPSPGSRLVVADRDGSHMRVLFQNHLMGSSETSSSQFQDRIIHSLPDDPEHVLLEMADPDEVFPSVYQLNVNNGALRNVVGRRQPVLSWMADRAGVVRFGHGFHDLDAVYVARSGPDAPWHTLAKFKRFEGARFEPLAFGPLPNQLFVSAPHEGRDAVWQMDLDENSDFQLVFSRPDVDAEELVLWPTDEHVVGFYYETDRPHVQFLDPVAAAIDKAMDRAAPDTFHQIVAASRDSKIVVIRSFSDVLPPVYHLLDTNAGKLTLLGGESRALEQAQLAPMQSIVVPGPGGIKIHGYLTLPVGTPAGTHLPAVVFPHGGPYDRDDWGYDPMVQLMANRGYAVLQLNFRGSTGYGEEWLRAGRQAWGTVMHEDITAGAHWLIEQGIADPARMCIVGWSYGGYAALIGVVKEPQLYRCAVSIAGVSDLSQLASDDDQFYGGRDAARNSTGTDKVKLKEESPVLHADRIKVPVLLVHGSEDFTVFVGQSEAMDSALKHAGVPHELVIIKDGEHSLLEPSMRLALYRKLEAFLAANLGPP
jgi:dienelactone hydrolase